MPTYTSKNNIEKIWTLLESESNMLELCIILAELLAALHTL